MATVASSAEKYEVLFNAVFDASRNAMLICDDDRAIVAANGAAEALTGYDGTRLCEMRLDDLYVPGRRDELDAVWQRGMTTGTVQGNRPLQLAGGGTIPIHFCATTVAPHLHLIVYLPSAEADGAIVVHRHHRDAGTPTRRQREVITQLALGFTTREIAEHLVVSEDTVRTHIRNAMTLTHSRNRAHLVAQSLQRGWIVSVA